MKNISRPNIITEIKQIKVHLMIPKTRNLLNIKYHIFSSHTYCRSGDTNIMQKYQNSCIVQQQFNVGVKFKMRQKSWKESSKKGLVLKAVLTKFALHPSLREK